MENLITSTPIINVVTSTQARAGNNKWHTFQSDNLPLICYQKLLVVNYFEINRANYTGWESMNPDYLHVYVGLSQKNEVVFYSIDNVSDKTQDYGKRIIQSTPAYFSPSPLKTANDTNFLPPAEAAKRRTDWLSDKVDMSEKLTWSKKIQVFRVPFSDLTELFNKTTKNTIGSYFGLNTAKEIELVLFTDPEKVAHAFYADITVPRPPFDKVDPKSNYNLLT